MTLNFAKHYIQDPTDMSLNAEEYSRFKYGDGCISEKFGRELGVSFLKEHAGLIADYEDIVLVPSPYDFIPTASYAMAMAFREVLNAHLFELGKKSLMQSKIHRYKTYTEDYGAMSHEERLALISSDSYHLDRVFLQNRLILFMDDIRITGSHEYIIKKQIQDKNIVGDFVFLYYAILDNTEVPANFENYLNYYAIRDMEGVIEMFNSDGFLINTRIVKFILKSDLSDIELFLAKANRNRMPTLVANAIGNNYHLMSDYSVALARIAESITYGNQSSKGATRNA